MSQLNRLTLEGFKSIKHAELELRALNILIGPNGAGKSNFLSFFRMLNAIAEGGLQTYVGRHGGGNALLYHARKRTSLMRAKLQFDIQGGSNEYEFTLVGVAPDDLMFADETMSFTNAKGTKKSVNLQGGRRESGIPEAIDGKNITAQTVKWCLDRWRVYHFHDTSADAPIKQSCMVNDNRYLRANGANLAAFLYKLKQVHPQHYRRIRDTVRMAVSFFDDFVLEPTELNPNYIQLEWREAGWETPFYAHNMSDGMLRFIALCTVLLQPAEINTAPHTIFIDEPELGLHPYAITLLGAMLRSTSEKVQVVISTQSVTLLDAAGAPEDVIIVSRESGQSTFTRLTRQPLESWLEEYTLGELWEKNVLGGRP